jgi:hypothetical protein
MQLMHWSFLTVYALITLFGVPTFILAIRSDSAVASGTGAYAVLAEVELPNPELPYGIGLEKSPAYTANGKSQAESAIFMA